MLGGIFITFITLISSSLTLLVATTVFLVLLKHLYRRRDVSLLLIANTYLTMIVFAAVLLSATVNVLKGDLYGASNLTEDKLTGCRLQGLFIYETFGCFNMSFALQAFFRLARIVYAKHRFLRLFSFCILLITVQWILSILLLLPSYFWQGPLYSFDEAENMCGIVYEKVTSFFYTIWNIYFLPLILLIIIYARLTYFILHHAAQLAQTQQKRRAQRDLLVIRRILFTVIILILPGIPNACFVALTNINRHYSGDFFMYRIERLGPSVVVFIFSIALGFITPKLGKVLQTLLTRGNIIAPMMLRN